MEVDTDEENKRSFNIEDEDTGCARLVGVYSSIKRAAEATNWYNQNHEVNEDDPYGGPIESFTIHMAIVDGAPGYGRHLTSLPITGNSESFKKLITDAFEVSVRVKDGSPIA